MSALHALLFQTIATLIGIVAGTLAALAIDRHKTRQRKERRAHSILKALGQELGQNHSTLLSARSAFSQKNWGRSFYVDTAEWETALASGDLADIIGAERTESLSTHYAILVRIRYFLDLLTNLWCASADIPGYDEKRRGFHAAIQNGMNEAIRDYGNLRSVLRSV